MYTLVYENYFQKFNSKCDETIKSKRSFTNMYNLNKQSAHNHTHTHTIYNVFKKLNKYEIEYIHIISL